MRSPSGSVDTLRRGDRSRAFPSESETDDAPNQQVRVEFIPAKPVEKGRQKTLKLAVL